MAGIMNDVSAGTVSPVFVGRETELAALAGVYSAVLDGEPATVLLGGEAGGGKTRLGDEFVTRAHGAGRKATGRVLVGGCLELSSASLPYAPFTAVLRQLARDIGRDEIAALVPGGTTRDLARLLPGFGAPPADPDPETGRVRLFEQILTLLQGLADQEPLILVVEDAHWADQSTRDLLVFLIRNLRSGPILLLVTFR